MELWTWEYNSTEYIGLANGKVFCGINKIGLFFATPKHLVTNLRKIQIADEDAVVIKDKENLTQDLLVMRKLFLRSYENFITLKAVGVIDKWAVGVIDKWLDTLNPPVPEPEGYVTLVRADEKGFANRPRWQKSIRTGLWNSSDGDVDVSWSDLEKPAIISEGVSE